MTATWTAFPTVYLCNLQDVKNFLKGAGESTWDNDLLAPFLEQASMDFAGELQRLPLPHSAIFKADYSKDYVDESSRYLNLQPHVDLLAVTSVTNGDGNTVDSSYYTIDNANSYPKTLLTMKVTSPTRWRGGIGGNYQQAISLTGIFGYVPHYDYAWRAKTTITEAVIDTTTETLTLTITGINIGDYLKIDSEVFRVLTVGTTTVTASRGELGTTAALHADNTAVYLFQQKADIKNAVREWAAYLWKTKDKLGEEVGIYEGFVKVPKGLSPQVINTVLRNRKVHLNGLSASYS